MMATTADGWISQEENDIQISEPVEATNSNKDSKLFTIVNRFMNSPKSRQSAYDDVYVARSEKEKSELIERLREETMKVDAVRKFYPIVCIG